MVGRRDFVTRVAQSFLALVATPVVALFGARTASTVPRPGDMDPLEWLRRVEDGEIEPPHENDCAKVMHETAIRATVLHPTSRRAWRYRASHGWLRAMSTSKRSEQVRLFGDVVQAGHRLMDLGAPLNGEEAWCDAIRYPSHAVSDVLDERFALTELAGQLRFFEVDPAQRDRISPRPPLCWASIISLRETELAVDES